MFKKNMRAPLVIASIVAFGFIGSTGSQAATQTNNFDVTATIIASCSISAGNLAFGNYDPLSGTDNDNTSTIAVTCSNAAPYTVRLDGGTEADTANRKMNDDATGLQKLDYQLYSDAPGGTVWGNTVPTGLAGTGTGSNQNITVHGRITAGQTTPPIGDYTDTVTATVEY